ncbi:TIGR03067 domain-containing protein [bacterium]|nr:TIGR03067 domain-containing protein [bacterium]
MRTAALIGWLVLAAGGIGPAAMGGIRPAAAAEPEASRPAARLQGTWIFTALVIDGLETPRPRLDDARLIVTGDEFLWASAGRVTMGTFTARGDTLPWRIDMDFRDPTAARADTAWSSRGIWRLDDGWLTICLGPPGGPRPDDYAAPAGSGRTLQILTQDPRETTLPAVGPLPDRDAR